MATEHSLLPGMIEGRPTTRGVRTLYLAGERLGQLTIAVSATVREELLAWGVRDERILVVPNGLDVPGLAHDPAQRARVRAELGIAPGTVVVGAVGRLVAGKQFDVLLRAAAPGLGPDRMVLVVGTGAGAGGAGGPRRRARRQRVRALRR